MKKKITINKKVTERETVEMQFPIVLFRKRVVSEYLIFSNEYNAVYFCYGDDRIEFEYRSDTSIGDYIGQGFEYGQRSANKARCLGDLEDVQDAIVKIIDKLKKV